LFLGCNGYVTCSVLGCKDPGAPHDLLAGQQASREQEREPTKLVKELREAVIGGPGDVTPDMLEQAADLLEAAEQQIKTLAQERDDLLYLRDAAIQADEEWAEKFMAVVQERDALREEIAELLRNSRFG
jgi:uncharacterized coiled-coil DUF342 family protein